MRALTPATLLALHRDDFKRMLGSLQVALSLLFCRTHCLIFSQHPPPDRSVRPVQDIRHMWRFEALSKVPLLAPLTPAQRSNLCTVLRAEHHRTGDVIIRQVLGPAAVRCLAC